MPGLLGAGETETESENQSVCTPAASTSHYASDYTKTRLTHSALHSTSSDRRQGVSYPDLPGHPVTDDSDHAQSLRKAASELCQLNNRSSHLVPHSLLWLQANVPIHFYLSSTCSFVPFWYDMQPIPQCSVGERKRGDVGKEFLAIVVPTTHRHSFKTIVLSPQ